MPAHIQRASGTILSAAIYNGDMVAKDLNLSAATNISRVQGLLGSVLSTTQFSFSAHAIVLKGASGILPVAWPTPSVVCNISVAGPIANGRDGAGVPADGSWLYFFFIFNGTAINSLVSLSRDAPTLPVGYTHWCYATSIRTILGGQLPLDLQVRGARVYYVMDDPPLQRVVNGATATAFTSVSLNAWIPPECRMALTDWTLSFQDTGIAEFVGYWRVGTSHPVGRAMVAVRAGASNSRVAKNTTELPTQSDGAIQFRISAVPNQAGGLYIDVGGYVVGNGDS